MGILGVNRAPGYSLPWGMRALQLLTLINGGKGRPTSPWLKRNPDFGRRDGDFSAFLSDLRVLEFHGLVLPSSRLT